MKVYELIQQLKKYDPFADVKIGDPRSYSTGSVDSVTELYGNVTTGHPTVHIYSSGRSE